MFRTHGVRDNIRGRNNRSQSKTLIVNNGEPITDGAPIIYTERKDGVLPEYDIRTDRWDIAIDAMDKINMNRFAKRENKVDVKDVPEKKDGSPSEN